MRLNPGQSGTDLDLDPNTVWIPSLPPPPHTHSTPATHHQIWVLAKDVSGQGHELAPANQLLVVQMDDLDEVVVRIAAAAEPGLDALKELQLSRHGGPAEVHVIVEPV